MTMFTKEINKDVPIPLYYQLKISSKQTLRTEL